MSKRLVFLPQTSQTAGTVYPERDGERADWHDSLVFRAEGMACVGAGIRGAVAGLIVALAAGTVVGGMGGVAVAQPASTVDWSGFELGGSIGATGGYSHVQSEATNKASGNYFTGTDFAQFRRVTDDDILQWRPSGGLEFGYTQQYGHILLGVAASANTLFLDQSSQTSEPFQSDPTIRFSVDQRVKADWQATLGPKLGWAQGNWQVFATGGLGPPWTRRTATTPTTAALTEQATVRTPRPCSDGPWVSAAVMRSTPTGRSPSNTSMRITAA
ncbi:MAG: hypothetical protein OJJ21_00370 [Ferrovibrio sp.]|nr:hypothetical protein [Ferrovibrio sp.]MCW0232033.1 hypothetical protein [Ferrovibrio sp.]